jgi:hypothetical protein
MKYFQNADDDSKTQKYLLLLPMTDPEKYAGSILSPRISTNTTKTLSGH